MGEGAVHEAREQMTKQLATRPKFDYSQAEEIVRNAKKAVSKFPI